MVGSSTDTTLSEATQKNLHLEDAHSGEAEKKGFTKSTVITKSTVLDIVCFYIVSQKLIIGGQ